LSGQSKVKKVPSRLLGVNPRRTVSGTGYSLQSSCPAVAYEPHYEPSAPPLTLLNEEENAFRETVQRMAREKIEPLVKQMDMTSHMEQSVIDSLFENGLMGIDVDTKYNGTGSTFFTTMLVIEELSKVDPSVGAMVEVHNSLTVQTFNKYASEEQKQQWLPRLSNDMVSRYSSLVLRLNSSLKSVCDNTYVVIDWQMDKQLIFICSLFSHPVDRRSDLFVCLNPKQDRMPFQ